MRAFEWFLGRHRPRLPRRAGRGAAPPRHHPGRRGRRRWSASFVVVTQVKGEFMPPEDRAQFAGQRRAADRHLAGRHHASTSRSVAAGPAQERARAWPAPSSPSAAAPRARSTSARSRSCSRRATSAQLPPGGRHGLGARALQGGEGRAVLGQRRSTRSAATRLQAAADPVQHPRPRHGRAGEGRRRRWWPS